MPLDKMPLILSVAVPSAAASSVDAHVFTAPEGSEWELVEVAEIHTVAGDDVGAVTADIVKVSDGTAPGSGTSMLASTFSLKSTANTKVKKNTADGLSTSKAVRTVRSGQTVSINFTGTLTTVAGLCFTFVFRRILAGVYR